MHVDRSDPSTATIRLSEEQCDDLHEYLCEHFRGRAEAQGYGKPTSAKYRKAEIDFFAGAMAALLAIGVDHNQAMNPHWVFTLMRGDSLSAPSVAESR